MRLHAAILIALVAMGASPPSHAETHPRIWLTPAALSALRAKAASGDDDWQQVKATADRLASRRMPRFTVTAATNANPVRFTILESVPWLGSAPLFIAGATGAWTAVNASGDRPAAMLATRVDGHSFTVPIDSTTFGSFEGQRLVLFFSEGGYSEYGYEGSGWQSALQTLGLAYQITGDLTYATKGIELIDYIASLGVAGMLAPAAIDSGFPSRSAVFGLAIGYDWLHDRLTMIEQSAVVATIDLWFDWFKRAAYERNGPAYGNYFGGHILGFGLAGLATEGDNPRGAEIVAHVANLFRAHVGPAFETGGFAGGYPVESYGYGARHFERLLDYMLAVRTATGDDILARSDYAQKIARSLIYNLKPNDWQVSDEGDFSGDYSGVLPSSLPIVLSSLIAGTPEGEWMQHVSRHLATAPHGGQAADPLVRFVFGDDRRTATDYRLTEPTWFHSPGDDHFYRRSSWKADAVWTSIAGGATRWSAHQMRSAGHIAIARGADDLLVNSGQWKGATGDFGMPQAFDLRSWRANTLAVDDSGAYLFPGANYVGGQGDWGRSRVVSQDGGREFGYVHTDLTSAYSIGDRKPWEARSVRSFHREFLSMGDGIVLAYDRVQLRDPAYTAKLYFHVNPAGGPPQVSGNTATIRVGQSALFLRALLPVAPVVFAAADPVSESDSRPITYRLEVSDSAPSTTFTALNVLVATASTTTSMPTTSGLQSTDGTMVGAMVDEGDALRVGMFAAAGTPQTRVRYAARYEPPRTCVHVLTGLVPHASFLVARDGERIGSVTASSQGVVTFVSTEGGLFSVTSRAATVDRTARVR